MKFSPEERARRSERAKSRKFGGNIPERNARGRTANLIGTLTRADIEWQLFEFVPDANTPHPDRNLNPGGNWSAWKLVALPTRPGKANFWFTYTFEERRFANGNHHINTILEHEPEVYAWLLATIDSETYASMA